MSHAITLLLAAAAALAALPVLVLALQVVLARGAASALQAPRAARPSGVAVAVLMPAHDEATGIGATLAALRPQFAPTDRILVVADNCSDDTAAIALAAGAEVIERRDTIRRGKGWALDFGVRHLAAQAPDVVVIVDADCRLDPGCLDTLVAACTASGRPTQALYEMNAPAGASLRARVSALAWRVRNRVRPLGWWRIGAPCQLMGTGMAFPWTLLRDAPLASGNIVEDVQLGVDLARRGKPPLFVPQARVSSDFPSSDEAAAAQRRRWEHGNMSVMLTHGPRLLASGVTAGNAGLVAMAADLMVPPLALLMQLQLALAGLTALAWMLGAGLLPLAIAAAALALLSLSIVAAWHVAGRDVIGGSELLLTAPVYMLRKLPMYLAFLRKRESTWVRAKREGE